MLCAVVFRRDYFADVCAAADDVCSRDYVIPIVWDENKVRNVFGDAEIVYIEPDFEVVFVEFDMLFAQEVDDAEADVVVVFFSAVAIQTVFYVSFFGAVGGDEVILFLYENCSKEFRIAVCFVKEFSDKRS